MGVKIEENSALFTDECVRKPSFQINRSENDCHGKTMRPQALKYVGHVQVGSNQTKTFFRESASGQLSPGNFVHKLCRNSHERCQSFKTTNIYSTKCFKRRIYI